MLAKTVSHSYRNFKKLRNIATWATWANLNRVGHICLEVREVGWINGCTRGHPTTLDRG